MTVLAGVKNENALMGILKSRGMNDIEAIAAKCIATKTSEFENEKLNLFYSATSKTYTLVEK